MSTTPISPAFPVDNIIDLKPGKFVGGAVYVHKIALNARDDINKVVNEAKEIANISDERFNVVKYDRNSHAVSLLDYPDFFSSAFPELAHSWKINLRDKTTYYRTYIDSLNPPILHRKELLLPKDYKRAELFFSLTKALEGLGLFDDPLRIGFKLQWSKLITERGFKIIDHDLCPVGNDDEVRETDLTDYSNETLVARHRTALKRYSLSAPMQLLYRCGFLNNQNSVFDYGCGQGDDLRILSELDITASGWDPFYSPDTQISSSDVVNLGFVLNIIEDPYERSQTLLSAYKLTNKVLAVSAMIASESTVQGVPFADGILTARKTFQKYYTQSELYAFLKSILDVEPIAIAPGVFFIFKDPSEEQRFQTARYSSRIRIRAPNYIRDTPLDKADLPKRRRFSADNYEEHKLLLNPLWDLCVKLGREAYPEEIPNLPEIEAAVGPLRSALHLVSLHNDVSLLYQRQAQRTDDILVWLALQQFEKRPSYSQLEAGLQRDIKKFFGSLTTAEQTAMELLFQAGNPSARDVACAKASDCGLGWYISEDSLELHSDLVGRLPPILRIFIGCAGIIYGDVSQSDVVKIHLRSEKVSFMQYSDFLLSPLPVLSRRMKINLRTQDMQIFDYDKIDIRSPRYFVSRVLNEETPEYAAHSSFDQQLESLELLNISSIGPDLNSFSNILSSRRWKINGFKLVRDHFVPNLSDKCGLNFTYRQLIECGETQSSLKLPNLPSDPETYTALHDLAVEVLDPIIDWFGGIELTYGFCSLDLSKKVPARNAPELDQHSSHDRKKSGAPICSRLGAAVDFIVRDENMWDVANWIIENTPFDRLYFYGNDRPVHVSYGPENKREAIELNPSHSGRLIPRSFAQ